MGAEITRSYDTIPGLLIPWEWQGRDVTDLDVRHATPTPGSDSYAGTSRARLQLTGTPSYTTAGGGTETPAVIDVVSVPGVAGRRLGWVWRRDGAAPWYGTDEPTIVSQYWKISAESVTYSPSLIALQSGGLLAAWGRVSAGVPHVVVRRRDGHDWDAADAESLLSIVVEDPPTDGQPVAIAQAPDGVVILCTLEAWTTAQWGLTTMISTDDGDTWEVASVDALRWTSDPPRVMRLAVLPDGRLVLAMTEDTGTSSKVRTAVSDDLGTTWREVEDTVAATYGGICCWDLRVIRGALVAVVEWGGGASGADTGIALVEIGDPESWIATTTTGTLVYTQTAGTFVGGACVLEDPAGADGYLVIAADPAAYVLVSTTQSAIQSITAGCAQPSAVTWRGAVEVIAGDQSAGVMSGALYAHRLGGQSDVTWTRDVFTWISGDDYPVQWTPLESIASSAWTTSDSGGTATRTHTTEDGTRVQTNGSTTGSQVLVIGSARRKAVASIRMRVASGTIRIELAVSDGTNTASVYVEVTPTQIRAYDASGAASSYVSHGATSADYIDVMAAAEIRDGVGAARCYWRADRLYPETCTNTIDVALATATGTTTRVRLHALPSTDVYWLRASAATKVQVDRLAIPTSGDEPGELLGASLSLAEPRYLADGLDAQVIGGMPRAETGVVHRIPITGSAPFEHMFPEVVASPRWGYTMPADQDITIKLRPTADGTNARTAPSEIFGLYLGGLDAVKGFTLTGFAFDASIDVDLRTPYRYAGSGYSVTGAASGGALDGRWVGQDELAGCLLECEDGLRRIVGNSPGSLHSGEAVEEVRAVLHLDGSPGVDGLGYIWPKTAMVLVYDTGSRDWPGDITLTISSADDAPGDTRTIGTLAAGYIQPMGMQWDRTESHEFTIGDAVERMPDGTSYTTSQDPGRRRIEVSLTESTHDLSKTYGPMSTDSSADYLVVPAPGSMLPGADADPLGMVWSTIAARGRKPVVLVHMTRSDDGSGKVVVQAPVPYRDGTLYARVAGDPRWQRVQLQSEAAHWGRLTTIAFEEIT